jgi:hypothetical protein
LCFICCLYCTSDGSLLIEKNVRKFDSFLIHIQEDFFCNDILSFCFIVYMYCDVTGVGIYLGEIWYGELPSEFKNHSPCLYSLSMKTIPTLYSAENNKKHPTIMMIFTQIFCSQNCSIQNTKYLFIISNSNQQKGRYHLAAFLSVVLITEMLEICIQASYDQNVQLILKSYLPVVYGTTLMQIKFYLKCMVPP